MSFLLATFERMPGSDTVENAALMAALSKVRGGSMPSSLMHSARMPASGMSASFCAASTVSSPIALASVSPSIPARSESAASSLFAVMEFSFLIVMFTSAVGCAASTASLTCSLFQPSEMAFASISGNSPLQTALIMPTRSRSALTAAWAMASTSTAGVCAGCGASGFSGSAASTFLGASAGAAGAGVAAGCAASTFFSGSIMELPFSWSDAVTFM